MWEEIVLHHAAASDGQGVDTAKYRRWHEDRGWKDIGYHFIVERLENHFEVVMGRPLNMAGSHCPGHNTTALGVCFAGNFMSAPPPQEQLVVGARLISGLCSALHIPTTMIYGHREFRDTACPGDSFPLDELLAIIQGGDL